MGQLFGSLRPILVAATLAGCLALIVFVSASMLWWNGAAFQAVSCVHPASPTGIPAMNVQVTTERKGHIVERHVLGCTFYSYRAGYKYD